MTVEEVREFVRAQARDDPACQNDHGIKLGQTLLVPQKISVIVRLVNNGRLKDLNEDVWLVGQESATDGYRIVMRERNRQFGLASSGFRGDKHLVLTGWYGGLKSAFLSM
ncbi:MAG: hypothetical protein WA354_06825 [Terracidiphilus sp.]